MKINTNYPDPIRSGNTGGAQRPASSTTDVPARAVDPVAPVSRRTDSVEISAYGKSLSEAASIDPERITEIRRKVFEGAYDSLDLVDQVARRILLRGDL